MKYSYGDMVYSIYNNIYDPINPYDEMMVLRFDKKTNRYICICNDGLDLYGSMYIELHLEEDIKLLNDELIPGSQTYNRLQEIYKDSYPEDIDLYFYSVYISDKGKLTKYRNAIRHGDNEIIHRLGSKN